MCGSPWPALTCFWVCGQWWGGTEDRRGQRWQQHLGGQQPRSAHTDREYQRGTKIKRKGQRITFPLPHQLTVALRAPMSGPAPWWGCLSPVSQHLLVAKKDVVSHFFLFLCTNQPRILSYRFLGKPAIHPIRWRQPTWGLPFGNC